MTLLAGLLADALNTRAAIWEVAAITALSGVVVMIRMYATHQPRVISALPSDNLEVEIDLET